MMEGFQLARISVSDASFLRALKAAALSGEGLERAEAYALVERESRQHVAYAALEIYAPQAMLRSLVVPEEHQGQGYGAAVCQLVFSQAAARGVTHIYALTDTAAGFFRHMGFEEVARTRLPHRIAESPLVKKVCPQSATAFMMVVG